MIRFGKISEIIPDKGLARVDFKGDSVVSAPLPCLVKKSKSIKESYPFEINEEVACLMNDDLRTGVILGAIYNKDTSPAITDENEFGIDYGLSGLEKFNKTTGLKTIKAGKFKIVNDTESLHAILNDILTQIQAITVTGNLGYPTGPPLNLAAFTAIQVRLQTFLSP